MLQLENKDNVRALLKSPVTSIRHRHETSLRIDYLVVLYQSSRGGRHWSWHDRFHMHSGQGMADLPSPSRREAHHACLIFPQFYPQKQ